MIKIKPPANFEKTGKIYTPEHHTVADWDFQQGTLYRDLSTLFKVSAPTSLRINKATAGFIKNAVLCRIAATQCLPQGEFRTWLRWKYYSQDMASFRNQAALGTANFTNTYYIINSGTLWRLQRVVAGGETTIAETTLASTAETWEHWRIVYWNGLNALGNPALCVEVYKEIAGAWTKQGNTLFDTANQWKDSAINRSGFRATTSDNYAQFWDDTEIWGAV